MEQCFSELGESPNSDLFLGEEIEVMHVDSTDIHDQIVCSNWTFTHLRILWKYWKKMWKVT